tara:strand:+ start:2127 stop:2759 length:633 start_codon:yes stop_codon:yes gene_type:complete
MKKQLLSETQVRKMMKFANIGALSDGFISKLNENELMDEEQLDEDDISEALEEDTEALEEDAESPLEEEEEVYEEEMQALAEQLEAEFGAEESDLGADMGVGGEEGVETEDEEPLCSAVTALKALKAGLEELDPEAAAMIQIEFESEEEEMPPEAEEEMPMGADEEELEEADGYLQENRSRAARQRQKKIILETTRRVAKRLLQAKRQSK